MTLKIAITAALFFSLALHSIPVAKGACCTEQLVKGCDANGREINLYWKACGDCTGGTPNCGYRKCNIFSCACGGGCRTGKCNNPGCPNGRGKRSMDQVSTSVHRVIRSIDEDKDGKLSISEAALLAETGNQTRIQEEFDKLDVNGDGFLSAEELDNSN